MSDANGANDNWRGSGVFIVNFEHISHFVFCATFDLNITTKFWLFIGNFSRLELFLNNASSQSMLCCVTARTLVSLDELSKILDHRYSLTEAATERCSLKIALI